MVALLAVCSASEATRPAGWALIGASSAGSILIGVRLNAPRCRRPWYLLGAGVLAFAAGDTVNNLPKLVAALHVSASVVSSVLYAAVFPLVTAGVYLLTKPAGRDRDSLLDAATFASAVGLLLWMFLVSPFVWNPQLAVLDRVALLGFPLGDVWVVAAVTRLLLVVRRSPSVAMLAMGAGGLLCSDVLYAMDKLDGTWRAGTPVDLGWFAFYALWGAAALHPSMTALTEPKTRRRREVSMRRLLLPGISSLVAPAVLLVESVSSRVQHGTEIALMSMVMFSLVMIRLVRVVKSHRRSLARERGLRGGGAALVAATDTADVEFVVRQTVARLLGSNTPHSLVLLFPGECACDGDAEPVAGTGVELRYTRTLPEPVRVKLGGYDLTLVCPLTAHEQAPKDQHCGALLLAAPESVLLDLQGVVEVLTTQAALAVERIRLSGEVGRRRSEEYFRTLVQNTADVILILDEGYRIRYASPSATAVLGLEQLVGIDLMRLVDPGDRGQVTQVLQSLEAGKRYNEGADWHLEQFGGGKVQVAASFRDLRHDRTIRGIIATFRDVTEQRRMERDLSHQALHDSLTGLANRVLFSDRIEQALARSGRTGAVVCVLLVDLDDFNVVNDTSGYQAGDQLLAAVGERLVATVRSEDTVARLGGDEFAILVEDASSPAEADIAAERVVAAFSEPFLLENAVLMSMVSVGAATTADAVDAQDLLRQADLALNTAKRAGKGQFRRYQPELHNAMLERLELRAALDRAVADGDFILNYQPIVDLASSRTVGFEALVRWNDPERGIVPPDKFIGVAEESGLIVPIGAWVLEQALESAARWCRTLPAGRAPYISVNVSARQFRMPGFIDLVRDRLERSGLPPSRLMLEITESLLLRDDDPVWKGLTSLRALGVRVAIDDFGTGYSSLSYLRQVPIDVVKLDRSFITTVGSSAQQRALVDGIVRLARTLELQVIAEGIEDVSDSVVLRELGCPLGQGYLFARPLSHHDADKWLDAELAAYPIGA